MHWIRVGRMCLQEVAMYMKTVFVTLSMMRKAENCFVLIVLFNFYLILTECFMKIRVCKMFLLGCFFPGAIKEVFLHLLEF